MSVVQITTRDTMLEKQRIGFDATMLELDTVPKVSVGSVVEIAGALYVVTTAAETPTGSAVAGAYLYFDLSALGFAWSATAGTYDPTKGAVYNGDDRRCRFRLTAATTWEQLIAQETTNVALYGSFKIGGAVEVSERHQAIHTSHGTVTENTLFDLMVAQLPTTGQKMLMWGAISYSATIILPVSYAEKISATVIRLYGVRFDGTNPFDTALDITDGDGTSREVSLAW